MLSSGTKPPGWVQQVHGSGAQGRRRRASSAASRSWPISTRRVMRLVAAPGAVEVLVEARAHALDQQAHRFAGDGGEALGAQDAELGDQLRQGVEQQAFVGLGRSMEIESKASWS
jgi:hypothetical protein